MPLKILPSIINIFCLNKPSFSPKYLLLVITSVKHRQQYNRRTNLYQKPETKYWLWFWIPMMSVAVAGFGTFRSNRFWKVFVQLLLQTNANL